ncbi:hypothetical protein O181_062715 [Austropuccinia psidii MF-1]|uniref:Uncharacterized protein n=1 Tax=Austropuccinia psidii MF-1 TaxID=1389203 RepID=A0A9Q3I1K6_9BASI|nr:hypothetical protein [Austropuccinia psidii MF-1]
MLNGCSCVFEGWGIFSIRHFPNPFSEVALYFGGRLMMDHNAITESTRSILVGYGVCEAQRRYSLRRRREVSASSTSTQPALMTSQVDPPKFSFTA